MTTKRERLLRSTILAGVASAVAFTGFTPAFAQDEGETETIQVTGSRIERSEFTSVSPITVVTSEDIETAGSLQLGEILRNQLAVGSGGFNSSSVLSGAGSQSIDLRNLGAARTLVLINGRRVANFADALQNESADLGFLPIAAIESIEILRDGASAVYGADAVAGVVNVILRDDFEGFELSTQAGISDEGDRESFSIDAIVGGNFDRGNIFMSAEYRFTDLVPQVDRDWAIPTVSGLFEGVNNAFIINGSGAHPGGTTFFSDGTQFCTLPANLGGDEVTNVAGTNCPSDFFAVESAFPNVPLAGSRYDYALGQTILGLNETISLTAQGNYDITNALRAFVEFQVTDRESESALDGNPIFNGSGSPSFPNGWVIPGNNPYNPNPGVDAQFRVRPATTVGRRRQFTDTQNIRIVAGLQGELFDRYNWEAAYQHTQVNANTTTNATFNLRRAITISDPALCALDPNCVNALQPGSLGALDVYRPGNWSESEIAYFRQIATSSFDQELNGFQAYISGPLFALPAGDLAFSAGVEYREESLEFSPDAVTEAGESVANQTFSTSGSFDTYEVYGEVDVPILANQPFAELLTLNLQGRLFDYSTFGQDSVYKVSLNWQPVEDVRFRSTFGTSFRQPTLVDIFSGGTVSFDFLTDPCSVAALGSNPSANQVANCASVGPLGTGTIANYDQSAAQLQVLAGGDLADGTFDLGPETGESFTLGAVFSPRWVPNLRGTLDYYNIIVEDFVTTTPVQDNLNVCYDSANFSAPECNTFSRNPVTRQLTDLVRVPVNGESGQALETAGLDWTLEYFFDLGNLFGAQGDWGTISLGHQGAFILDYNFDCAGTLDDTNNNGVADPGEGSVGPGCYDNSNGAGVLPEYRLNFQAEWTRGIFGAEVRARYIPEVDDLNYTGDNVLGYDVIDDQLEFDLRFMADVTPSTALLFGVNNVTDEDPPYVFNTGNNTSTGLYGSAVIGRYFFGRVTQTF